MSGALSWRGEALPGGTRDSWRANGSAPGRLARGRRFAQARLDTFRDKRSVLGNFRSIRSSS